MVIIPHNFDPVCPNFARHAFLQATKKGLNLETMAELENIILCPVEMKNDGISIHEFGGTSALD